MLFVFWECERPSDRNAIDGFACLLSLLQGSHAIVDDARRKIDVASAGSAASVEPFLTCNNASPGSGHAVLALDLQKSLQNLHSHLRGSTAEPDTTASLNRALSALCIYHSIVPTWPITGEGFMSWLFTLDAYFVSLLQRREPLALCMLAHWSVPLSNAPQKWYAGDWPRRLLSMIMSELSGTEWQTLLQWPVAVIQNIVGAGLEFCQDM